MNRRDMKRVIIILLLSTISLAFISCKPTSKITMNNAKQEIEATEQAFAEMTKKEGIAAAFLAFADEKVVLNRNSKLVKGKTEMEAHFAKQTVKITSLTWTLDFVEVSSSGDLGYTYGEYQIIYLDNEGKEISDKGIFHTVWKKQADGKWKFVWD